MSEGIKRLRTLIEYPHTNDDQLIHRSELVSFTVGDIREALNRIEELEARIEQDNDLLMLWRRAYELGKKWRTNKPLRMMYEGTCPSREKGDD